MKKMKRLRVKIFVDDSDDIYDHLQYVLTGDKISLKNFIKDNTFNDMFIYGNHGIPISKIKLFFSEWID